MADSRVDGGTIDPASFDPDTAKPPPFVESFADRGYAVVEGAIPESDVEELRAVTHDFLADHRDALGISSLSKPEMLERALCVHQPHKISPRILDAAHMPAIVTVLRYIIGDQVKMMQSQMFLKGPGMPGNGWHQDESAIPTRDKSLVGIWIPLDRATRENGCLRVVPGSHRTGYLFPQRAHFDDERYDFPMVAYGFPEDTAVDIEVSPGDLIAFSGYLVHGSEPNKGSEFRRALTFHYMNAYSLLPWKVPVESDATTVRVAQADYRDVVMITGDDPYAWKGYADLSVAHLRRWRGWPGAVRRA